MWRGSCGIQFELKVIQTKFQTLILIWFGLLGGGSQFKGCVFQMKCSTHVANIAFVGSTVVIIQILNTFHRTNP